MIATRQREVTLNYCKPTDGEVANALRLLDLTRKEREAIHKKSPAPRSFLIELANASYGYIPPPNQVELGGYETWLGTSRFEKESSDVLVKALLVMLGELWGE